MSLHALITGLEGACAKLALFAETTEHLQAFRALASSIADNPATPEVGAAARDLVDSLTETSNAMLAMQVGMSATLAAVRRFQVAEQASAKQRLKR